MRENELRECWYKSQLSGVRQAHSEGGDNRYEKKLPHPLTLRDRPQKWGRDSNPDKQKRIEENLAV